MPRIIETGKTYGRLKVEAWDEASRQWLCRCSCGGETHAHGNDLRAGRRLSCGCLHRESQAIRKHDPKYAKFRAQSPNVSHGHTVGRARSPEYRTWIKMKSRCDRPANPDYATYGGRGITVCGEWQASFETFLRDMGPRPGAGFTIDRLDPDDDYKPSNCRWVPNEMQGAENRRGLLPITVEGVTYKSTAAACRAFGIGAATYRKRRKQGYSMEAALTLPLQATPGEALVRQSQE